MNMVFYSYKHCNKEWEERVKFDRRDRVKCVGCGELADRQVSSFNFTGATYVGTDKFKGAELGLGVKGIESSKEVDAICELKGVHPVDAYHRQDPLPAPKEITMKEIAPYLDGMPLN